MAINGELKKEKGKSSWVSKGHGMSSNHCGNLC